MNHKNTANKKKQSSYLTMKVTIGSQASGSRKEKDSRELPLDFYNLSKCMTILLELDSKDTIAILRLEKLCGNRFVEINDKCIRVQKESKKKEFEEGQQCAIFCGKIQFAIKNNNYNKKIDQRMPFYRLRVEYLNGDCEFYYFTVRNGGSTDYAKYREDLTYYIGPVNSKKEAMELFNQKFGSYSSNEINNDPVTDALSDIESTLPIETNDEIENSRIYTNNSDDINPDPISETLLPLDSILSYGSLNRINSIPTNESPLREFEWTTQEQYISTENYLSMHGFEDFQNCSLDSNSFIDQLESSDNQQSRKRDFSSINTEYYTNNYLQENNQFYFAFEPELFDYLSKIQYADFSPRKRKKNYN